MGWNVAENAVELAGGLSVSTSERFFMGMKCEQEQNRQGFMVMQRNKPLIVRC